MLTEVIEIRKIMLVACETNRYFQLASPHPLHSWYATTSGHSCLSHSYSGWDCDIVDCAFFIIIIVARIESLGLSMLVHLPALQVNHAGCSVPEAVNVLPGTLNTS